MIIVDNNSIGYKFSIYRLRLVISDNKLISRQFIVIKDDYRNIIAFTRLHKYIHSTNKYGAKSISDNGNNRFHFVVQFLNYLFIYNYSKYRATNINQITLPMLQDFFRDYGIREDGKTRTKRTVDRCSISIIDFILEYISQNTDKSILKKSDFVKAETYRTRRGMIKTKYVLNFQIFHSGDPKTIFRDMPNTVFNIFLSFAATYYKDIFFLIALSAFAGLRPSEACNIRQEISPLGSGIYLRKVNGKTKRITLDITKELNLRSDLIPVGTIKKERMQGVYSKFIAAFEYCYILHKDYLATQKFEKDFCPMNVNSRGMAMTYDNYYARFRQMTRDIIPLLFETDNPEVIEYAHDLQVNNISPHIFRHWFSVRLTLYGEDIAGLQYWRGDKSPESALTYLQNKGELEKQLRKVNNEIFDFMIYQSKIVKDKK
jgi:integrase